MDGPARTPAVAGTVAAAFAALAAGAFFGTRGLAVARQTGLVDLSRDDPGWSSRFSFTVVAVVAGGLLAVLLTAVAVADRLPGWQLVVAGLALDYLATETIFSSGIGRLIQRGLSVEQMLALFVTAVVAGLVLGGALSALARLGPSQRWLVVAALAGGLILHPAVEALFRLAVGTGVRTSWPVQIGVSVVVAAVAAVFAHRERSDRARGARRIRIGVVVTVVVAVMLILFGYLMRWLVLDVIRRNREDLGGLSPSQFAEPFAYLAPIAVALVSAVALFGYAHRIGRAAAARWVVLGFAAGPLLYFGLRVSFAPDRPESYLVALAALAAVGAGAVLARRRPGLLPWDAAGVALAALALAFAVLTAMVGWTGGPSLLVPLISAVGSGLALGAGLVLAAGTHDGLDAEPGRTGPVLALGAAAATLSAVALAPALTLAPGPGYALVITVLLGACALALALLFGLSRTEAGRMRPDARAEPSAKYPTVAGRD